jgi:hypothetical protein
VIEPRVRDFAWDDFAKTPQLIAAGEEVTLEAIPRVRAALDAAAERAGAREPRDIVTGISWGSR